MTTRLARGTPMTTIEAYAAALRKHFAAECYIEQRDLAEFYVENKVNELVRVCRIRMFSIRVKVQP